MNKLSNNEVCLKKSAEIFNELMKGKIINEFVYNNKTNSLEVNSLFNEIRYNFNQYNLQYKMNGMTLVEMKNYFYLIDGKSNEDTKQPIKTKILASLIVLIRYITSDSGKVFDYLKNVNYGATVEDLKGVNNNSNYTHILQTAKIENGESILKILFDKNILLKTSHDRYILSDSGKSIVDDIIYVIDNK